MAENVLTVILKKIKIKSLKKSRLNAKSIVDKKIDTKIENIQCNYSSKKEPILFLMFQIIGTLFLLLCWSLQNITINELNADSSKYNSNRSDMLMLSNIASQELFSINLYRNFLDRKDTSFRDHLRVMEAYRNYCNSITNQVRLSIMSIPLGSVIPPDTVDVLTKERRDSVFNVCKRIDNETNKYVFTKSVDSMDLWQKAIQLEYETLINNFMQVAHSEMAKKQVKQNVYNNWFIAGYTAGSILLWISLFKDFRKK